MAKNTAAIAIAVTEEGVELSTKVVKAIEAIRAPFASYSKDFAALTMRREELAPKFMRAFGLWQSETGGSFVDFCRMLDSSIPRDRDGYRAHKAFQAADYLRRLVARGTRAPGTIPMSPAEKAEQPTGPVESMARVVASLMPLIRPEMVATLWAAMTSELRWSELQVTRLQNLTENVSPLVDIKAPHGLATRVNGACRVVAHEDIAAAA